MNNISTNGIVLVAEDDLQSVSALNDLLAKEGFTVLVAMNGDQAVSISEKMPPDIILMDAIMPKMDGFEATQKIKSNSELNHIPIIFMTGLSDNEHVLKGLACGSVDYINKPINHDQLIARLKIHLNNSRLTLSARQALDEIGQSSITTDISGNIIWQTESAANILNTNSPDPEWILRKLPHLIKKWLIHEPQKNSSLDLKELNEHIQLKYIGRIFPGEHLFRLVNNDELFMKQRLKERFNLTDRESEVLLWLSYGKTNREIGVIINMSPRTVNKHLEQIFKKLDVENRTTAAAISLQYISHVS